MTFGLWEAPASGGSCAWSAKDKRCTLLDMMRVSVMPVLRWSRATCAAVISVAILSLTVTASPQYRTSARSFKPDEPAGCTVVGFESLMDCTTKGAFIHASAEILEEIQGRLEAYHRTGSGSFKAVGYDPATILALKVFQGDHGLAVTGELDQKTLEALHVKCPTCGLSRATLDAFIAGTRIPDFQTRHYAVRALWQLGADAVPAIPALMDVLGDERNNDEYPKIILLINGQSASSIGDLAEQALRKLIPVSNGLGFDRASQALLSPRPDLSRGSTPSQLEELTKLKRLAGILPRYGSGAMRMLLTLIDSEFEPVEEIRVASTWALRDFGKDGTGALCDVLRKHMNAPPSETLRATVTVLLQPFNTRNDRYLLQDQGGPLDQEQARRRACGADR